MDVILIKDVEHLGSQFDLVKVRPGYARNFLIPRGMAQMATASNRKALDEIIKQKAHKAEKIKTEMEALAVKLKESALKIPAKVGENGKIFGSVNAIQISEAIHKLGYIVDRRKIEIESDHIKTTGTYPAKIKLSKDLSIDINFEVVAE